jgi:polysaccharide pyruvyl transferase WcaK-like protein
MINICITGWYGTETIGDRAILDGIFQIFQNIYSSFEARIGSLYPLLTQRTLLLDGAIFSRSAPGMKISLFDLRRKQELIKQIKECDCCVMGGGPVMDIDELAIIAFAFKTAKKHGKKTAVLGCGLGPLNNPKHRRLARTLFHYSDIIIFRDTKALQTTAALYGDCFNGKMYAATDPAVLSVGKYLEYHEQPEQNDATLAINFREFPQEYSKNYQASKEDLRALLESASKKYERITLVPMHTFFVGRDDRKFLSEIAFMANKENISVEHKPLSIYDTFSLFQNSAACIGMRYHSIVFQTLVNGNNYILDYTDKENGKIISFLDDIDKELFYKDRYINLIDSDTKFDGKKILSTLDKKRRFDYQKTLFGDTMSAYKNILNNIK